MSSDKDPKDNSILNAVTDEALTKAGQGSWQNEGGHMSSIFGRVKHVPGSDLPFVVTLTRHERDTSDHEFATMREAEAFIERNTPIPRPALSSLYDRPASDFGAPPAPGEGIMNDENIIARLKVIDERMRQITSEEAASVLAGGLAHAGINEQERLRLIAETERILDELDGKTED